MNLTPPKLRNFVRLTLTVGLPLTIGSGPFMRESLSLTGDSAGHRVVSLSLVEQIEDAICGLTLPPR